jgi:hypothetical protein
MKKLIAAFGIVGALISGAACSSTPSGPPTARSVLAQNGYTYNTTLSDALSAGIGSQGASAGILSSAAGEQSGNVELVIIMDGSAEADTVATTLNGEYASDGITTTANGDVITATGTFTDFSNIG